MNQYLTKGQTVRWEGGFGTIQATFSYSVTRFCEGRQVTRTGRPENKALLIQLANGKEALRLESEVRA